MSYKANLEQLSISPTGKAASATQADSATTATTATNATSATSAGALSYTGPVLTPMAGGTIQQFATTTRSATTFTNNQDGTTTLAPASVQVFSIGHSTNNSNVYGSTSGTNAMLLTSIYGRGVGDLGIAQDVSYVALGTSTGGGTIWIGTGISNFDTTGIIPASSMDTIDFRINLTSRWLMSGATRVQFTTVSPYAYKQGGGTWGTVSDARLKTNLREIGSALEKISALHPVHFDFINQGEDANPTGTRTGFIAQEFEQVLPGHTFEIDPMVEADKNLLGEGVKAKGIDADLVPYLVKAIQELKAELDTVKAELATLKG